MQLWHLARNPIENWAQVHFEKPILSGSSMFGQLVVVNEPSAIRRVFVDNAANYEKDPLQLRVLRVGAPNSAGQGLLSATGDTWRQTRRALSPLFTPRRVAAFGQIMKMKADERVDAWLRRRPGSIVEIDQEMVRLTYDMLSATLFSDALDGDRADVVRQMSRLLDTIGRIDPLDALNAPEWLPRFNRAAAREPREWFAQATERMIDRRSAELRDAPERAPLVAAFGGAVFGAATQAGGNDLWCTDGPVAGPNVVADSVAGSSGASPAQIARVCSRVFYRGYSPAVGVELYVSDNTVVGTYVGFVALPSTYAAVTYAIGRVFVTHFEAGGTFLDFDPNKTREYFKAEFEKAKAGA
jgi:ELWxxDGT repeat protein